MAGTILTEITQHGSILSVDPKDTEPASEGYGSSVSDSQMLAATVAGGFVANSLLEGTQVQTVTSPDSKTQEMIKAVKSHFFAIEEWRVLSLIRVMASDMTVENLVSILNLFPKNGIHEREVCQKSAEYFAGEGKLLTKERAAVMVELISLICFRGKPAACDNGRLHGNGAVFWGKLMKLFTLEDCMRFMRYFEVAVGDPDAWENILMVILVFRGCDSKTEFRFSNPLDKYGQLEPIEAKEMFDFMQLFDTGKHGKFAPDDLKNFVAVISQYVIWRKENRAKISIKLDATTMPVLKAFLFQTAATLVPTYKKKVPMPTAVASELVTQIQDLEYTF